jgi:hypothetical protein
VAGLAGSTYIAEQQPHGAARTGLAIGMGLALHLAMDYTNSYGLHPWYPFNARWFYGDMVFIVEPLFWVVLGVPLAMLVQRPGLRYGCCWRWPAWCWRARPRLICYGRPCWCWLCWGPVWRWRSAAPATRAGRFAVGAGAGRGFSGAAGRHVHAGAPGGDGRLAAA